MGASGSRLDDRLSRRELLRQLGRGGLAAAGLVAMARCKGSTTPQPPEPPPPAVRVNVLAKFFNHTQGHIGDREYSGLSDSPLVIKISDCPDISTVDPNRFAVREAAHGGWLGRLVEFSASGQLSLAKYPGQDMEYDIFLLNKTNNADYSLIEHNDGLYRGQTPAATWDREDHDASGPDEIPHEAMRQISQALTFPWAKYMEFTELQPFVRGDFWVGYLIPYGIDYAMSFRGLWSEIGASVNPEICADDILRLRVFIEMIIGHIVMKMNFASNYTTPPSYEYLTDNKGISLVGRDILACSVVKDRRYVI